MVTKSDFTEEKAGDYRVVLTLGGPGGSTTDEVTITVEELDARVAQAVALVWVASLVRSCTVGTGSSTSIVH